MTRRPTAPKLKLLLDAAAERTTKCPMYPVIQRVVAEINAHPDDEWNLAEIVQRTHYSRFHVTRLFNDQVGLPPQTYVSYVRFERAKHILLATDMKIADVAGLVGFTSIGTFSSKFTRYYGLSPRHYRRIHRQGRIQLDPQDLANVIAFIMSKRSANASR